MTSHQQLLKIAKAQRGVLLSLLSVFGVIVVIVVFGLITNAFKNSFGLSVAGMPLTELFLTVASLGFFATILAQLIFFFRLGFALNAGGTAIAIYTLGLCIPLVSLAMHLWMSSHAPTLLRAEG